ncbi:protein disulfide oxidoreductase [Aureococcus anophagefferens]|nr:protein disulfide oxidoreductase [Aureococcus anophagefferens]
MAELETRAPTPNGETTLAVLTDEASLTALGKGKVLVLFGADWDEPSQQLNQLFAELARLKKHPSVTLASADAEECEALAEKFGVEAVPTLVTLKGGEVAGKAEGVDAAAAAAAAVEALDKEKVATMDADEAAAVAKVQLEQRMKQLIFSSPAMLFMKGSPEAPRCGFSRKVCELLQGANVPFATFDILLPENQDEMAADGDLLGQLELQDPEAEAALEDPEAALNARLKALVNQAKAVLFMKGTPGNEKCGFSKTIVALLRDNGVEFDAFDILTDDDGMAAEEGGLKAQLGLE